MQAKPPQTSGNYIHNLQMSLRSEHQLIRTAYSELIEVYQYLVSEKFHNDPTVQVADVMRRLDPVRMTLISGESDRDINRLTKSLIATGEITSL